RHIAPDAGLDPLDTWVLIKHQRLMQWRSIGVPRHEGGTFGFCMNPLLAEPLLIIDRSTGIELSERPGPRPLHKRLMALGRDGQLLAQRRVMGSMSEAAESSILEGAASTRQDAIRLLREGREPATLGERMIVNNYIAMQRLKQDLDRPLSLDLLLEWHEALTAGTMDAADVGRVRRADENVRIDDTRTGETIFTPPPTDFLPGLLRATCEFAAREHSGAEFIHPVVKACILHFLIGYAHPFVDGNGRTARAAFYWCALRHGYAVFEFCSISEVIRKGYARYPQAYLDTELDDGDTTYFVMFHLDVIRQALDRLGTHLEQEQERVARSERLLAIAKDLNLRQRLLLDHALRHPLTQYTAKSHSNSNGITPTTARTDLEDLVRKRLMLSPGKRGKEVLYMLAPGVEKKLDKSRGK
ncbi:MAG: Fic family protein, partial [Phycisphaerales bacterium]|nr:Fic family protein [Phycisphaerales bacterium]